MGVGNGVRFIDKLLAASPTERRKITVLGQEIFFKPLTRKALVDAMPKDDVKRDPDFQGLFMLVHCAEAEDGTKLFRMSDIDALREGVSLALLQEIETGMLGVLAPSDKQVSEDANADPPSASV